MSHKFREVQYRVHSELYGPNGFIEGRSEYFFDEDEAMHHLHENCTIPLRKRPITIGSKWLHPETGKVCTVFAAYSGGNIEWEDQDGKLDYCEWEKFFILFGRPLANA